MGNVFLQKWHVLWILMLLSGFVHAQKARLSGYVNDAYDKEPLIGASVKVTDGTNPIGTTTDANGHFSFDLPVSKIYTLYISSLGYADHTIESISLQEGGLADLPITLDRASKEIEEITVTAGRVTGSQKAVLSEIKAAAQVASGISSEQIKISQDKDAAQVMARIPGITIVDNKFVMVRGLPERYNQVLLNNVIAPSTEVDRRTFSFDLIPSNVLDRMMVYKSGTAEDVGDYAGGLIKLYTQSHPGNDFLDMSLSVGYRTGTTFSKFLNAPGGSASDLLGFDRSRGLPEGFPSTQSMRESSRRSQLRVDAGRSLSNSFEPQEQTALPQLGLSLAGGKVWRTKGNKEISTLTALNYAQSYQYFNRSFHRYFTQEKGETGRPEPIQHWFDYNDHNYEKENRVGIVSNWMLRFDSDNRIEFRNLFNQIGENVTVLREGVEYQQYAGMPRKNYLMSYRGRSIYNGQVEGTHSLGKGGSSLNWVLGANYLNESEPDLRRFRTFQPSPDDVFQMILPPSSNLFDAGRYYGSLNEKGLEQGLNFEKRLGKGTNDAIKIKTGYLVSYRSREFSARYFSYLYPGQNDPNVGEQIKRMPLSDIFSSSNIKTVDGLTIEEGTRNIDQYGASNLLAAGYVSTQIPLGKLHANVGMRLEYNRQKLDALDDAGNALKVDDPLWSPLAFINLDYKFGPKSQLRFAYGRTVNRPEFRELAPFVYYDFKMDVSKVGNPRLKTAFIHNFDMRYEWYPREGETVSLGVFYKQFQNPIETQIFVMTEQPGLGYTNASSGRNYGAELELRKSLKGVTSSGFLDRFAINLNASVISSEVRYVDTGALAQDGRRPLQGQSPYIINAGIYYSDPVSGTKVGLGYNVFGRRIFAVGSYLFPTIYELPRHSMDLTVTQQITQKASLKLGVQDILNAPFRFYQDSNVDGKVAMDDDHPIFNYKKGTLFTLTFNYSF